jgi:hypothetical protein
LERETRFAQSTAALEKNTFESLMDEGVPEDFIPSTVEQLVAVYYVKYSKENHGLQTQRNFLYTVKSGVIPVMGNKFITEIRRKDAISGYFFIQKDCHSRVAAGARNDPENQLSRNSWPGIASRTQAHGEVAESCRAFRRHGTAHYFQN